VCPENLANFPNKSFLNPYFWVLPPPGGDVPRTLSGWVSARLPVLKRTWPRRIVSLQCVVCRARGPAAGLPTGVWFLGGPFRVCGSSGCAVEPIKRGEPLPYSEQKFVVKGGGAWWIFFMSQLDQVGSCLSGFPSLLLLFATCCTSSSLSPPIS